MVDALVRDPETAPLDRAERALVDYAVKLTRSPSEMTGGDVERLREAGWSDAAILDLNLVTAYFAFVNRVADGLGVELEPRWPEPGLPDRKNG